MLDTSPPPLSALVIQGTLMFDNVTDATLTATYIIVTGTGQLRAGQEGSPHAAAARIVLSGTRQLPSWYIDNNVLLGAKVTGARLGRAAPYAKLAVPW